MIDPKQLAIDTAMKSKHHKAKVAAVLVKNNKIIAAKTNVGCKGQKPTPYLYGTCAECRVLKNPPKCAILDSTLYVARVKNDNTLGLAKPCPLCEAMIRNRKVKEVYYTTDENTWNHIKYNS